MLRLEEIKKDAQIKGLQGDDVVRVIATEPVGNDALTVVYKDAQGRLAEQMLFRSDESRLSLAEVGKPWAFDAKGRDFKLGLEAYRISQAALFDPMMAVHTSNVDPLPHQISAVYEAMLPRTPLRFVLADDPGSGKTIMAGLLIRELLMRADARRILIVAPGSLVEQWQEELYEKFSLTFEIFSRERQEQAASGNFFDDQNQIICRLDQLSRDEEFQDKLRNTEWDLIIVDEAHKLSASYYGSKVEKTKRFQLGEMLGSITRHFLLMTATPHNGKEEDFQIWLSLLDTDRFYGKFRDGAHKDDVSDMMRRMVKEELLKFDGTPLFPERKAYTANYDLSDAEASLYQSVTDYVREEMNRADNLDGKRKGTVGFALTLLQRRLASSPEAIFQSLSRRRKRLESRLEEEKLLARGRRISGAQTLSQGSDVKVPKHSDIDDLDDELNAEEFEEFSDEVVDQATAAATIEELEAEIDSLGGIEKQAKEVVQSGNDRKWEELSSLLQDKPQMFTESGSRRKLIIFTEHKDTLNYLVERVSGLLGDSNAVVTIYGGTNRDNRRKAQERFRNDPDVHVLIATDAAGEGVNLQNANLMVNYDLPWNPNRLEQRFGRIHRIGQTEICHLWNLVANETREGDVFRRLFEKLEIEKQALGGKVFDILGEAFDNKSLKDLLIEAIRYGESPEQRKKLNEQLDGVLDTEHLREILKRTALVEDHMNQDELYAIKDDMEKAEARKLQPHFIRSFFQEAFAHLDGELREREKDRFEIKFVPPRIREHDRIIGETRTPVLKKYERICFEKDDIRQIGKPVADLVHPAHPLMHATTSLILADHRKTLTRGAVLVDPTDEGIEPSVVFMISHEVKEGRNTDDRSEERVVSRRLQFISIDQQGTAHRAGWAPHLDYEPMGESDQDLVADILDAPWIRTGLEERAILHAGETLVPEHFEEVRYRRHKHADKTLEAVHRRLVQEINYLSNQALKLKEDVKAGKQPKVQPQNLERRAEELTQRLETRTKELEASKNVISSTPVVIGGALVIPRGLLKHLKGETKPDPVDTDARAEVERIAMQAVTGAEESLGHEVFDVSAEKCGWDLTGRPPLAKDGSILPDRHIEVKGRAKGQTVITVSKNEIMYALNQSDKFWLAVVLVDGDQYEGPFYIKDPFQREPDFGVASSNYEIKELLKRAVPAVKTI